MDDALNARLKASVAAYNAMPPLERAIHDLKQKRSFARGLSKMSTPTEQIDAALDKLPEYVVLKAYEAILAERDTLAAELAAAVGALMVVEQSNEQRAQLEGIAAPEVRRLISALEAAEACFDALDPREESGLSAGETASLFNASREAVRVALNEWR